MAPSLTAGVGGLKAGAGGDARAGGGDAGAGGDDGGAGRYGRAGRVCCDDGEARSGEISSMISRLCHRMVMPTHCTSVVFPSAVGMSISLSSYIDFKNCSTCMHMYIGASLLQ